MFFAHGSWEDGRANCVHADGMDNEVYDVPSVPKCVAQQVKKGYYPRGRYHMFSRFVGTSCCRSVLARSIENTRLLEHSSEEVSLVANSII